MSKEIPHTDGNGKGNARSTHRALARRSQQQRLIALAQQVIRGETTNPKGHLEIVLSRIRPEPTPLPVIQNGPCGRFISDPQARVWYLRNKFGFTIENRIDRSASPALSFYWLVLDASGTGPKMNSVEYAEENLGIPEAAAQVQDKRPMEQVATLAGTQSGLFGDMAPAWRDPEQQGEARR